MRLKPYMCKKCFRIVARRSRKAWMKSYCESEDTNARLYRLDWWPRTVLERREWGRMKAEFEEREAL